MIKIKIGSPTCLRALFWNAVATSGRHRFPLPYAKAASRGIPLAARTPKPMPLMQKTLHAPNRQGVPYGYAQTKKFFHASPFPPLLHGLST